MIDGLTPIIDFSQLDLDSCQNDLISFCETKGYFYLINHNININDFHMLIRTQLFNLSLDERFKLYPTTFIQSTGLATDAPESVFHEGKESFLIGQQEVDYNENLKDIYKQCQQVKIRLLEKVTNNQQSYRPDTSQGDCFQFIRYLDVLSSASTSKTLLDHDSDLLLQIHFPSSDAVQIINSHQQNLFTPEMIENNCLLITIGSGLYQEQTMTTTKLFYQQLVNNNDNIDNKKSNLFDIRFMAYNWELDNNVDGTNEKFTVRFEPSSSSTTTPSLLLNGIHSSVDLLSSSDVSTPSQTDEGLITTDKNGTKIKQKSLTTTDRSYFLSLTDQKWLRYFTFFYLYFMQGLPAGFSGVALANYLTAEGKESSTVGTFVSISALPWALQFVWGPLIDRFQTSSMGRRRPWVIFSQIAAFSASLGLLFVKNPIEHYVVRLAIAFCIHSVFASIQDASVDAQAITTIPIRERGRINGFMRGGMLMGSAVGSAGLSYVLRTYGYYLAAGIVCSTLLFFTIITFFIKEKSTDTLLPCKSDKKERHRPTHITNENQLKILWLFKELFRGLLAKKSLKLFIPIVLCYASQSAFIKAYNFNLINQLKWTDTSVSILSGTWGTLIIFGVVIIGGYLSDKVGAGRLLVIVIFIHGLYMFTINSLNNYWVNRNVATAGLILWNFMDPLLSVSSMPILMSLCRSHVEGSQFTAYMSMVNLCDITGSFISGHLQTRLRAHEIGFGCAVIILIAFIVVAMTVYRNERKSRREKITVRIKEDEST